MTNYTLQNAFTEKEAAAYIGMSVPFLRQSRMETYDGTPGPAFIKAGRAVRYTRADLDAWLAMNRVTRAKEKEGEAA